MRNHMQKLNKFHIDLDLGTVTFGYMFTLATGILFVFAMTTTYDLVPISHQH